MDVEKYLKDRFVSRATADEAMRDFSTLKRRLRKYSRGTNSAHSILNLIIGIENTFGRRFVIHMMNTRFDVNERLIYLACVKFVEKDFEIRYYDREFFIRLEKEVALIRKGE